MSNLYFDWPAKSAPNRFVRFTTVRAADVNNALDEVSAGFEKMPTPPTLWGSTQNYGEASGGVNAWAASISSTYLTTLVDGLQVRVKFPAANSVGAPTFNLNGLGAKSICRDSGVALSVSDITADMVATLTYNSDFDKWQLAQSPLNGTASDINAANLAASSGAGLLGFSHSVTYAAGTLGLKGRGMISVKDAPFNAKGDGITDDTAAFQAAISYLSSITPWPVSTSRGLLRPVLNVPAGVYKISSKLSVLFNGFTLKGDGSRSTLIAWYGGNTPVFDIGTFSATPSDLFTGSGDATFIGVRIQHYNPSAMGSRQGQGIRSSGGGALTTKDVAVLGFAYGINSPYGGDFNNYQETSVEYCDVGVYQGPGGQQWYTSDLVLFACVEGMVMDRCGQMQHDMLTGGNCRDAIIVLEAVTDTSTRQLSLFPTSGTSYQQSILFNSPWLEGNAGGMGDDYTPTNYFVVNNNGGDAYRDITINCPILVAGFTGTKSTTAYFANLGAQPAQRVRHNNIVFSGVMTRFLTAPQGDVIDGYRVSNGYTAPAFSNGSNYGVLEKGTRSFVMRSETMGHVTEFVNKDDTQGVRAKYDNAGIISWAFRNAGAWLTRFGIDIQNRRLFFGDPANNEFSISRSTVMPSAGTYEAGSFVFNQGPAVSGGKTLLGWQRLTTGNLHLLNTDWSPCYVTNT